MILKITRKAITTLLLAIPISGCEQISQTRICNQTKNAVLLKITFDSTVVKTWSGGAFANELAGTFREWDSNLIPVAIDTARFVASYTIAPDNCSEIEGGIMPRPSFRFYRELEITEGKDTLRLRTKEEMSRAFNSLRGEPTEYFDLLIHGGSKYTAR